MNSQNVPLLKSKLDHLGFHHHKEYMVSFGYKEIIYKIFINTNKILLSLITYLQMVENLHFLLISLKWKCKHCFKPTHISLLHIVNDFKTWENIIQISKDIANPINNKPQMFSNKKNAYLYTILSATFVLQPIVKNFYGDTKKGEIINEITNAFQVVRKWHPIPKWKYFDWLICLMHQVHPHIITYHCIKMREFSLFFVINK